MSDENNKRWTIAIAATIVHLFLGTVYAWSFFQKSISEIYGWGQSETAWAFSISIFMLGITAGWCGLKIKKFGAKRLAITGVVLYSVSYIISYFALHYQSLFLLYFGFGIIGGIGLGMAYVTPVAVVSSWFPDKQGLMTGIVVMGFGLGASIMSNFLAPFFLEIFRGDLAFSFLWIGISLLFILVPSACFLSSKPLDGVIIHQNKTSIWRKIITVEYSFIWLFFTFNIIASMVFIAFQSSLLQDILRKEGTDDAFILAQKGAMLIGVSALFNGIGRFFWGSLSDKIGRVMAFRGILFLQILTFISLIFLENSTIFIINVSLILFCNGGGFGVLPSLIREKYGRELMPIMYGLTLIGWGLGGIIGPQIMGYMKDNFSDNAGVYSFYIGLILVFIGFCLSLFVKNKK